MNERIEELANQALYVIGLTVTDEAAPSQIQLDACKFILSTYLNSTSIQTELAIARANRDRAIVERNTTA